MKFRYTGGKAGLFNLYGHTFKKGVAVEVGEPRLIAKFKKYPDLEEVVVNGDKARNKKQGAKKAGGARPNGYGYSEPII